MERPTSPRNDTDLDHTDKKATVDMTKVASIGVGEVGEVSKQSIPEQLLQVLITSETRSLHHPRRSQTIVKSTQLCSTNSTTDV